MSKQLLSKGFEVELFTGRATGENVGISNTIVKDLPEFVTEPDLRNIEYTTLPISDYDLLSEALLQPRRRLRYWLEKRKLTLLPGSTLSLGDINIFERSDLNNSYHDLIESTYGTRVVTASIHINLGIKDLDWLFAAVRLVRCEAAMLLALSASSPFLGGKLTDHHSQRWNQFPLTPQEVPIFLNHNHYIRWFEKQLEDKAMCNERHLWTSVRPNGSKRPYKLNRLELRICDLVTSASELMAITALLELRVLKLKRNLQQLDPLHSSKLAPAELANLAEINDAAAAESSLEATLLHWRDGHKLCCKDWILEQIDAVKPLAVEYNLVSVLAPLNNLLEHGNQAMRWRKDHLTGSSISALLQSSSAEMVHQEALRDNSKTSLG